MEMNDKRNELVATLNDLVKINQDRVEGYQKAQEQAKENPELQSLFSQKAAQSEKFSNELKHNISSLGGEYVNDTTTSGKIFRAWMDVKNTFNPSSKHSILDSCEFGEDAALKAYKASLESDAEIPAEIRQTIASQHSEIQASHDTIKKYRDANA